MNVLVVPTLRVAVMRGGSVATTSGPELLRGVAATPGYLPLFACIFTLYLPLEMNFQSSLTKRE